MGSYPEFSSVNVGWSSYADWTCFIPYMLLFDYVSPCLLFWIFMVRCAADAAWTTPGLVTTGKRCFKLTCLYQVRVFSRSHKQVGGKIFVCSKLVGFCKSGRYVDQVPFWELTHTAFWSRAVRDELRLSRRSCNSLTGQSCPVIAPLLRYKTFDPAPPEGA